MTELSTQLSPLWELTKARLREFAREKGVIFWVFAFPLLMALGLGIAFRTQPQERPKIAVVSAVESSLSRALLTSPKLESALRDEPTARKELARAKVDLVVVVESPGVRYLYDLNQSKAPLARLVVENVVEEAAGRKNSVPATNQTTALPGSRYIDYLIPGLIGMNLMGTSMWGVGYTLVLARKRRLLRRYAVTPMNRAHFLLSYFFSRAFFLFIEIAVLVLFGWLLFGTKIHGNYFTFALIAFLGAASFAGISLLIGARIENTESANGWMNLVQLPMWVLSGIFFSYERFPPWLHVPLRLLPLTALNDSLRLIYNDGAALVDCTPQLLVLVVWGAVGFVVALRTFRWQ